MSFVHNNAFIQNLVVVIYSCCYLVFCLKNVLIYNFF